MRMPPQRVCGSPADFRAKKKSLHRCKLFSPMWRPKQDSNLRPPD